MLRYRVRIAPVEPALTYATPCEVVGFEDSALGYASLAIVHIRLRSGSCAGAAGFRPTSKDAVAAVLPATLPFLPDQPVRVPGDAWQSARSPAAGRVPCASSRALRDGRQEKDGRTLRYSRLNSGTGMQAAIMTYLF